MGNTAGRDARQVITNERRAKALELRLQGKSYAAIAAELGLSVKGAHKVVQTAISRKLPPETVEEARRMELARLDEAFEVVRRAVIGGDLMAVEKMVQLSNRRAKFLGLDAPVTTKTEIEMKVADELRGALGRLEASLSPEAYADVLRVLALTNSAAGAAEAGGGDGGGAPGA